MRHHEDWFIKRIGKKIYRDKTSCKCSSCEDGFKNGVLVHDKFHAEYLHMVQWDLGIDYYDVPRRRSEN